MTKRVSHVLCEIIKQLVEGNDTHCDRTQDMIKAMEDANERELGENSGIVSLDIDALYPSLNIDRCTDETVRRLKESEIEFNNLDWKEIGMYLRYHLEEDDIEQKGYAQYCPTKRRRPGRFPRFEANGTARDVKKRQQAWQFPRYAPNTDVIRIMFCDAIGCMIKRTMKLHDFSFDGKTFRQRNGGAIGMDLTGVLADVYMCEWDKALIRRVNETEMACLMYKRYKDDINALINNPNRQMKGLGTMNRMIQLANGIDDSLRVKGDCGDNYEDGKMPILDLRTWIEMDTEGTWKLKYEHYMKKVSSRMVINATSAHGERMKENVNVNECLRIVRNCSENIGEGKIEEHISHYMKRMQFSGYSKKERLNVVKKTIERTDKNRQGLDNNSTKKRNKDYDWYLKGNKYDTLMVVDATPGEKLKKTVERIAKKHGIRVKVIERRGRTTKGMLQKSNPFGIMPCREDDCVICRNNMGVDCRKRGVVYQIECEEQNCGKKYIGQTGRTLYERFKGHEQRIGHRVDGRAVGPLEKHREEHGDSEFRYKVNIKDQLYGKATKRMISETVRIDGLDDETSFNRKKGWTCAPLYKERICRGDESFENQLVDEIGGLEMSVGFGKMD